MGHGIRQAADLLATQVPDLYQALERLLLQIPPGRLTTYGRLALALGHVQAAKWISYFLLNEHQCAGVDCPCYRVVSKDGSLSGSADSRTRQQARLAAGGYQVVDQVVQVSGELFEEFLAIPLLLPLIALQEQLSQQVHLRPLPQTPRRVAGVDLSYPAPRLAIAAYVLIEYPSGKTLWSATRELPLHFPYITGLLSFRELPVLLPLLVEAQEAGQLGDVILVDGNGILHPRQAGIASHLGVISQIPTIGVAKKLLCGDVREPDGALEGSWPIEQQGVEIGRAMRGRDGQRAIYVSPGHGCTVPQAAEIVATLCNGIQRLPVPTQAAHTLATSAARAWSAPTTAIT